MSYTVIRPKTLFNISSFLPAACFVKLRIADKKASEEELYIEVVEQEHGTDTYYGKIADSPKKSLLKIGQTIQFEIADVLDLMPKE